MKSLLNSGVVLALTLSLVVLTACEGRNPGEVTFPPRKATFPLAFEDAPADAPEYTYELEQVYSK